MEVSGKLADDVSELCDVCQSDSANGFCNDCKEYMCQGCFQDHKKAKPCRHHVLAPIDQAVSLMSQKIHEEKCKVHTTENIRYYCRKHDVVGCGDCIVSKHDGCKAEIIKDLAIKFEDCAEFKEMLNRIQKYSSENNENTNRLENNIKRNKAMIDKALDEIRKFRKEINDYIDQAEKNIIIQANKHSKNNETMFSQLQHKIAEVTKEIDELQEKLDTNVHKGEDLFIRMVECKGREPYVQQTIAETKSRNVLKTFVFQPEQKLKHMFSSNLMLGSIKFINSSEEKEATCEKTGSKMEHQLSDRSEEKAATCEKTGSKMKQESDQSLAKTEFSPPDPRSAGFDVGKRVKSSPNIFRTGNIGTGTGTIVSVDPRGWVKVRWDQGGTYVESAGAGGLYHAATLNDMT